MPKCRQMNNLLWVKKEMWVGMEKKLRVKDTESLKILYCVLHSSLTLANVKVYEVETFFIEKLRQFRIESYINISGTENK